LIGPGSEVLGFDDEMSTDHHYGPRLLLFLTTEDYLQQADKLHTLLANKLPYTFRNYSTHFSPPDPDDNGSQLPLQITDGPINHRVEIHTLRGYVRNYLGYDIDDELATVDWLMFPEQRLRTLTAGAVYADTVGLQALRDRFAWYPHDVWLYQMAAVWARIGQEEHLMGRAGFVGDEIGSALLGARLVRDVMRLGFLMERQYAPYPKWFGSAFKRLDCAQLLLHPLQEAVMARTWQERERHLSAALEHVARMHNALGVTERMPERMRPFHGRPFQVMAFHGFSDALLAQITDPAVKLIAARPPIGGIDLISDNTDLLESRRFRPMVRALFE
jgi:hypothetical protein